MEIQLPMVFFITFLTLASFILFLIKPSKEYQKLPPSPPKLPIIGHLHHLVGGLPHQVLAKAARKYGPTFYLQLGEVPMVVISSREAAKEVLKAQDPACTDRHESMGGKIMFYNYSDIAFGPYGEYWKQMRTICILELLSPKNVKSFSSIRKDEAWQLIESIRSASAGETTINLTQNIFLLLSSITCRVAFGKVRRDYDKLLATVKSALKMAGGFALVDLFPSYKLLNDLSWNRYELLRMRGILDSILDEIVEEHRLKPRGEFGSEDIVDVLLRMKDEGLKIPITIDNIKATIFDMFAAGTGTSATTLDFAMAELMRNPEVMGKVQSEVRVTLKGKKAIEDNDLKELKYLKLVIKETLRLHPPFPIVPRGCTQECIVDGYSIPPKFKIMVNVWSLGRDPKYWVDPETFQPERFENSPIDFLGNNFEYIPFGSGRRMCPGLNFGLANVELPLALMLYHFDWKMPKGLTADHIDMTEIGGLSVSRKSDLFLVPKAFA